MASAHPCSRQSWRTRALLLTCGLAAACGAPPPAASLWPPSDLLLRVEERVGNATGPLWRCFHLLPDGTVVYALATQWLPAAGSSGKDASDGDAQTKLPVPSCLSIYRLVPECARALTRQVARCEPAAQDRMQGQPEDGDEVVVHWRALGQHATLTAYGRLHGAMAEILALVNAHLPAGEQFAGKREARGPSRIHGAPPPVEDAVGALAALQGLAASAPRDPWLALQVFSLACQLGEPVAARDWLARWEAAELAGRQQRTSRRLELQRGAGGLPGASLGGSSVELTKAQLERLLPPVE